MRWGCEHIYFLFLFCSMFSEFHVHVYLFRGMRRCVYQNGGITAKFMHGISKALGMSLLFSKSCLYYSITWCLWEFEIFVHFRIMGFGGLLL